MHGQAQGAKGATSKGGTAAGPAAAKGSSQHPADTGQHPAGTGQAAVNADEARQQSGSNQHHGSIKSPGAKAAQDQQLPGSGGESEGAGLSPAEKVRKDEQQQR